MLAIAASAVVTFAKQGAPQGYDVSITPARKIALDRVESESLKAHVAFLASDTLEGRATPSRGLDTAAEYIAAQFRRAGLQPGGDNGYFQMSEARANRTDTAVIPVRNVIGILRGTDPKMSSTCAIVSAHYDHLGVRTAKTPGEDVIYNGANDDASGTAGVIELALAFKGVRPKRSIVFVCFFGEERGLLGSRFYGLHPPFPAKDTVAMMNLEQIGRTDDLEGERMNGGSLTGFDFSELGSIMSAAGEKLGVKIDKHPTNSDAFFGRSDNQSMADLGVPAHTLCTAFIYPDYHKVSDHWDKLNYENMAKIVRTVGLTLFSITDSPSKPQWNISNPKTKRYVAAAKALIGQ